MTGQPWLLGYMLSEPGCVRSLAFMAGGMLMAVSISMAWLSGLGRLDVEDNDLDELSLPVRTYRYSAHAEVRAYDGMAEFVRSGVCVGRVTRGAACMSWSGGRNDWILTVEYDDGRTDRFSCGPAGWHDVRRAGNVAMRFAGRHSYG